MYLFTRKGAVIVEKTGPCYVMIRMQENRSEERMGEGNRAQPVSKDGCFQIQTHTSERIIASSLWHDFFILILGVSGYSLLCNL